MPPVRAGGLVFNQVLFGHFEEEEKQGYYLKVARRSPLFTWHSWHPLSIPLL